MDTINSRNTGEVVTQDNVYKSMYQMPDTENLAGKESDVSTTAGYGTTAGQSTDSVQYTIRPDSSPNSMKPEELNISYSTENRSAQFKNGEGAPAWSAGAGENQYQGK